MRNGEKETWICQMLSVGKFFVEFNFRSFSIWYQFEGSAFALEQSCFTVGNNFASQFCVTQFEPK